jgi:hypothetical protein
MRHGGDEFLRADVYTGGIWINAPAKWGLRGGGLVDFVVFSFAFAHVFIVG